MAEIIAPPILPDSNDAPVGYEPITEPVNPTPQPKVVAGALAGSATTIILFLMSTYTSLDIPAEVGAAITTILSFVLGYITSND